MTSLDILAYAILKEELVNTPESNEVRDLNVNYPNLVTFVRRLDEQFTREEDSDGLVKVLSIDT